MSTNTKSNQIGYIFLGLFVLVLTLISFLFFNIEIDDINRDNFGMFGDYFGGLLTPTLTFITVIYLIKSINQQSAIIELTTKQLDNSTEELKLTREELSKSAIAQNEQARHLQESNSQALLRNEVIQNVDLIKSVQLNILQTLESKVSIFRATHSCNTAVMLADTDEMLELEGLAEDEIKYIAPHIPFTIRNINISRVEKEISLKDLNHTKHTPFLVCENIYFGYKADVLIRNLEKNTVEYIYAFNSLLSSNTIKFCLHYIYELSDYFEITYRITKSKKWIRIIMTQSNLSLELLEKLSKGDNKDDNFDLLINIIIPFIDKINDQCKFHLKHII